MKEMARIIGRLIGAETGIGIPYVLVQANGLSTVSGLDGSFGMDVPPGRYTIGVRSPIHKPVQVTVDVANNDVVNVGNIQMISAIFGFRDIIR